MTYLPAAGGNRPDFLELYEQEVLVFGLEQIEAAVADLLLQGLEGVFVLVIVQKVDLLLEKSVQESHLLLAEVVYLFELLGL